MLGMALSLLGIGKRIMSWLAAGVKWIFGAWERIVIAALLCVCVVLYIGKGIESRRADKWATASQKWQTAHELMVTANRLATEAAKANVKRVEAEYERIGNEAEKDYAAGLAANRSNLERWKLQNSRSATRNIDSPGQPEMPGEPLPPTGEAQFLVTGRDLEIASDNYSQLVALIEWAENIGEVETVPTPED